MATRITDIKVVATAPEGINLLVVKVETNQPGLVGLGCATFAYRQVDAFGCRRDDLDIGDAGGHGGGSVHATHKTASQPPST